MSAQASPETSAAGVSAEAAMSPMTAQYHAIKAGYPDCLLFYRMGDLSPTCRKRY